MGILPDNSNNQNITETEQYEEEYSEIQNRTYIIETSIAPENIKPFFENQEVVIPTQILKDTDKNLEKIIATPTPKKHY